MEQGQPERYFNTSHVSINRLDWITGTIAIIISIHLMFLLIGFSSLPRHLHHLISIHLMFLLIRYPIRSRWIRNIYFNTSHVSINRVMRGQTVQNYLHFNTSHVSINPSCNCGEYDRFYHFNTSHVSINPARSNGAAAGKKISIHLMFLLIFKVWVPLVTGCTISIHLMFPLIESKSSYISGFKNFNTSHVSINPAIECTMCHPEVYFNTSHVSINPDQRAQHGCSSRYFNTSHVSINHRPDRSRDDRRCTFQYISCFY